MSEWLPVALAFVIGALTVAYALTGRREGNSESQGSPSAMPKKKKKAKAKKKGGGGGGGGASDALDATADGSFDAGQVDEATAAMQALLAEEDASETKQLKQSQKRSKAKAEGRAAEDDAERIRNPEKDQKDLQGLPSPLNDLGDSWEFGVLAAQGCVAQNRTASRQ